MVKKERGGGPKKLIIVILAAVMVVSGGLSLRGWMEQQKARQEYDRLAELARETVMASETETEPETSGASETEPQPEAYVSPIQFGELREENPDTVGWLRIEGTNIDYPILKGEDNDFYLHHDFYGKESVGGSVYLDFESQGDFEGRNQILYGHNMKNGSMFRDVIYYKEEDYFKEHQYFSIYTPEREIRLKAVACYYGEAAPVVRMTGFKSQESFDAFVKEMVKPCSFAEEITYPVRTLYTFVTCSYEINDARTFLFAVEVDEDGREIPPDEAFQKKMEALMIERAAAKADSGGQGGQQESGSR